MQEALKKTGNDALATIAGDAAPFLDGARGQELHKLAHRLQSSRFHLALVGDFKRGKSTLGNALLGEMILPVSVVPATALPTFIRYSAERSAAVHFLSGETTTIDLANLVEYVSETENAHNIKHVRYVEVFHPAEFLKHADLLDTPGIGSAHVHNTETVLKILGEIDAAIVVLSADQPAGEQELNFLERLSPNVGKFIFVMNRADAVSDGDLKLSLRFARNILSARGFAGHEIFPISARAELEARVSGSVGDIGFRRFDAELRRFLREERAGVFYDAIRKKLDALISARLFELRLSAESSKLGAAERAGRIAKLQDTLREIADRRPSRKAAALDRFHRLLEDYDSEFSEFEKRANDQMGAALRACLLRAAGLSNRRFDRLLSETAVERGNVLLNEFLGTAEDNFARAMTTIAAQLARDSSELTGDIDSLAAALFGISPPPASHAEDIPATTIADFSMGDIRCSLEEAEDFLLYRAPRPLARRALLRRATRVAWNLINRNGGRIRYDLLRRGEEFLRNERARLERREDEHAARLLGLIGKPQENGSPAPELPDAIVRLETLLTRLEAA